MVAKNIRGSVVVGNSAARREKDALGKRADDGTVIADRAAGVEDSDACGVAINRRGGAAVGDRAAIDQLDAIVVAAVDGAEIETYPAAFVTQTPRPLLRMLAPVRLPSPLMTLPPLYR